MESGTGVDVSTLIVIGTMGILILVSFIVLFVLFYQKKVLEQKNTNTINEFNYQKNLLNASLEIAEKERAKVAANLHDDIGIILSVLKLKIHSALKQNKSEQLKDELLNESNKLIEETIEIIRNISNDLVPPALNNFGITSAFFEMCDRLNSTGIVEVKYEFSEDASVLDKKKQLQFYRLVKEILNNVLKHARASKINIATNTNNHKFVTVIEHNGMGVTSEEIKYLTQTSDGLGLKSIAARAQLINANLNYLVKKDSLPQIIIEIPLS